MLDDVKGKQRKPKAKGRPKGRPTREEEVTTHRVNVHLTDGQYNSVDAAHPGRPLAEVVLLALASYCPGFHTRVSAHRDGDGG